MVQREAMLVGPPVMEWLSGTLRHRPMVLDIDDAVWLSEESFVPSALYWLRRWPGKAEWLIRHAAVVTCGNPVLAAHVQELGARACVVPNAVDTEQWRPAFPVRRVDDLPVVGWVGSHGTFPYLGRILPALEEVNRRVPFRLRVVGSGRDRIDYSGHIDLRGFELEREVEDFATLDIGLYPLDDDPFAAGKSGLKAIQYLSVGVPYVASPVGVVAETGVAGETHFEARNLAEWQLAVETLLRSSELRRQMGDAGRRYALDNCGVELSAALLSGALRNAGAWSCPG
jgi:glycosyltransferase involved in cell wall biosynthesis